MKNRIFLFLIVCMSTFSCAQTIYGGGGGGFTKGMGYKNPDWYGMAGIEISPGQFFGTSEYTLEDSRKIDPGSGYTIRNTEHAYWHPGNFLIGPGMSLVKLDTKTFAKSAVHPEFGGGYWKKGSVFRCMADYIFSQGDFQNGVQGVDFRYEVKPSSDSRFIFRADYQFLHYHVTFQPTEGRWGDGAQFSLFFRWHL